MKKGTMTYMKRFTTGRKCSKIVALLAIVFGIELIIHSNAFSGFVLNIATGRGKTVQSHTRTQSSGFGNETPVQTNGVVLSNSSFGTSIVNQSLSAAKLIQQGLHRSVDAGNQTGHSNGFPAMKNTINVFNSTEEKNAIKQTVVMDRCVRFFSKRNDSVICVYRPHEDVWVSWEILKTGAWELDLLNMTRDFYLTEPNMQLLDVGCNIGVFTLNAAILGHNVVALDANKVNLRMLSMSLTLNDLHDKVTLVWNAVSDVYEEVELRSMTGNVGGTFVRPVIGKARTSTVTTIKIDDLLPTFKGRPALIKMDIEGSEWKALNSAWGFFKEVDVRYVLMEYVNHKGKESGIQIQKFFANFGFLPYKAPQYREALEPHSDLNWTGNVLWIKQNKVR